MSLTERLSELRIELYKLYNSLEVERTKKKRMLILKDIDDTIVEIKATSITDLFTLDSQLIESQNKLIDRLQSLVSTLEIELQEKTLTIQQFKSEDDFI